MHEHLLDIGSECTTLVEILRWRALYQPDWRIYTFLADGEVEERYLTCADLDRRARAIGALLQSRGAAGERVLLLYPAGLEYIAAFFGCLYAGAIAVPSYPPRLNRPDPRLQAIAADAQATMALTTARIASNAERRLAHTPGLESLHWLNTQDIDDDVASGWRDSQVKGDTLAFLQYTSGSTATPKGVMVSHENILRNEGMIQEAFGHTETSTVVGWLPIYHDMGLIGNVLQPLYVGCRCILLSPVDVLQKPFRWLDAVSRYRAHTSGGPNFAYDLCVQKISLEQRATLDLSGWEVAFNGAEPVRHRTLERFVEAFEPWGFRQEAFYPCYGLAEATLFVSGGVSSVGPVSQTVQATSLTRDEVVRALAKEGDQESRVLVGCGQSWADERIVIADPGAAILCSPERVGEIWVSGPNVAQGYWNNPEETARIFHAFLADTGEGPFLRTGDLGVLQEGELFITGRVKDLIIIRGRNHYPQDIELTVEESHEALQPGGGAAFSVDVDGEERLVVVQEVRRAHRRTDVEEVMHAIRRAVAEEHELQVYAVVLIKPMSLLKTSSGKVRRRATRSAFLDGSLKEIGSSILDTAVYTVPDEAGLDREALLAVEPEERRSILETFLRTQVAQVLRVEPAQVDLERSLIALGIDSLMAVDLLGCIQDSLGVTLTIEDLLRDTSVAQLVNCISGQLMTATKESVDQVPPLQPAARTGPLPLSFEQERLWALDQLSPDNPAYHIAMAVRLEGALDVAVLERGLNEVMQRHEALRTSFVVRDGRPVQTIAPSVLPVLPVRDLRAIPKAAQATEVQIQATQETRRPFDLTRPPLMRSSLLRLQDDVYVLVLTMHHIISDVASVGVLLGELATAYRAFSAGEHPSFPALPIQYVDFACWQRDRLQEDVLQDHLRYWRKRLVDAPRRAQSLPTDRPRPEEQGSRGAHFTFDLSPTLTASLRALSREAGVTLFMTLLTGFKVLLSLWGGGHDILVGVPTWGRTLSAVEDLVGFFAYPLMMRTDLSGSPTFREALERVRESALGAYAHQDVPFAQIVRAVQPERRGDATALFQVMFSLTRSPLAGVEMPGLTLSPVDVSTEATDLDLFLTLVDRESYLHGVWGYNADLWEAETLEHLVRFYCAILEKFVQSPKMHLKEMRLPGALKRSRADNGELVVTVAATFTAEPVQNTIAYWMDKLDMPVRIVFAPYNQVFQQLFDSSSLLRENGHGINVILVRVEDWQRFDDGSGVDEKIDRNARDLIQALKQVGHDGAPYLVCLCPSALDTLADPERAAFFAQVEARLAGDLSDVSDVHVVTPEGLADYYPVADYYDAHADKVGHIPYTQAFFTALGTMIARRTYVIRSEPYKVIVLDCDQTLWNGVCGEDGPTGIEIDSPRAALQAFMVAQHDAGMLLCLCSKNDEADVMAVFEQHPEMLLKWEHLVSWRIDWQPKSENIRALAQELELGLDSFIFIDDNPVECAEIQANCPEVLTLQLPQEAARIPQFLKHVWAFDHLKVTEADVHRTASYRQNAERARFQQAAPTLEDFLAGLELEVDISELTPQHLDRVAQLTQRTNQFNTTTIRRSAGEIRELCLAGEKECFVASVRDRFGDYGLVGVVIFEQRESALWVDTFLLSCRVLGRRVEHQVMAQLGETAQARGLSDVTIPYSPTRRNQPVLDFLNSVGGKMEHTGNGIRLFHLPVTNMRP